MDTSGVDPYHSSPPRPSQTIVTLTATQVPPSTSIPTTTQAPPSTADQIVQPILKRVNQSVTSKKAPCNVVKKGGEPSKKHKSKTTYYSATVHYTPSITQDPPVNVEDETHHESSASGDVFR